MGKDKLKKIRDSIIVTMVTFATLQAGFIPDKHFCLLHPLDERIELAGALEGITGEVDIHGLIVLSEIVHGMQIALEHSREFVPSQIQEAQVMQAR